ncbi:MAG: MFS transporter [Acidobacteria bacterium]|nr:MFS transporter [Acidobacteriota bacterium]MCL5288835.1 MFS transporter [Acidobacteriota bacterium]
MSDQNKAISVLTMNTLAFTVCFACWMMNGVLITYLIEQGAYKWTESQIGWLIGIPVLSGSLARLPVGILTDKYGGRPVYGLLMLISAIPMYFMSQANSYQEFLWGSLGFGLAGASFAVGIAYTSVWFRKERQGTALGIFGAGNAGAALTSMGAPFVLQRLTNHGANLEAWRTLPKLYALALVVMAIVFFMFTYPRKVENGSVKTMRERLAPLNNVRVWRFGLYYFLVFGAFVALSQWLIPYYVNVYFMPVTMAGLLAATFSLPSGVIRALGGWMSDHYGARRVMYWVLGTCAVCCTLLIVPRMEVTLPGKGVMATLPGTVTTVSDSEIVVGEKRYSLKETPPTWSNADSNGGMMILPRRAYWQKPVVNPGEKVLKKQLLASGVSVIYFQANVWIFTSLVFVVGIMMGIGKAAVYRHIPDYFPQSVGVVGGIVGVIGGLGGFVCPILFGYLLERTGVWTTSWMFLAAISIICLVWMHLVIQKMMREKVPQLMRQMESEHKD